MPTDPEKDPPDSEEEEADTTNTKDVDSAEAEPESSPDSPPAKSARDERPRRRSREREEQERRPRRKKKKRPKRPLPRTEDEIDAPDKQTLWMLGALASMVLIMWGGARFACNAHPDETRKPREIATADIATDPKGAAIELAHRWATRNFDGALELAGGQLAAEIQQDRAKCESNSQCTGERESLKKKVLTTGELLTRQPTSAAVRVTSIGAADAPRTFVLELTADGRNWKATAKSLNAPAPVPSPTGLSPVPLAPSAAPSATPPAIPSAEKPAKPKPKPKPKSVPQPAPQPVP